MADQTRRYFADSTVSYALAAIALVDYARSHPGEEFAFGPLSAQEMTEHGLTVSGRDLDGAAQVLAGIEGLTEYRPGEDRNGDKAGSLARLALCDGLGSAEGRATALGRLQEASRSPGGYA